jgi:hypothetical protein
MNPLDAITDAAGACLEREDAGAGASRANLAMSE